MNYKEPIYIQQTKGLVLTTHKKGCCLNGGKDLEESLTREISLEKTCLFSRQEYSK